MWCLLGTLLPVWAATTPVQAEILLQTSPLAGFRYYAGKSVWQSMHEGDALVLVREPTNAWDVKAIRVEWHGYKLGYVPRRENAALARLMDHGVRLKARIVRLVPGRNPWRRVLFEIYRPLT
uniref:HIRAN domain-containing protein n=1 Tax=mine drainage metagenome TaxID=410659 RepID=E6QTV2_9ZZZZ